MKTLYTSFKIFALLLFTLAGFYSKAQMVEYLNATNVNAGIGIGGNLFTMFPDTLVHDVWNS